MDDLIQQCSCPRGSDQQEEVAALCQKGERCRSTVCQAALPGRISSPCSSQRVLHGLQAQPAGMGGVVLVLLGTLFLPAGTNCLRKDVFDSPILPLSAGKREG